MTARGEVGSEYDVVTIRGLAPRGGAVSLLCFAATVGWWQLFRVLERYRLWGWDIGLGVTAVLAAIGFTAGFRARRAEKGALAAKAGMWLNLGAAASLLLPALLFYVVAYS